MDNYDADAAFARRRGGKQSVVSGQRSAGWECGMAEVERPRVRLSKCSTRA